MARNSTIEWTEATWNPATGCSKISEGCKNCYAERISKRLKAMGQVKYKNGFELTIHPAELQRPLKWKKPHFVFSCSMSDMFHDQIPDQFILDVFKVMNKAHWHVFMVLTKRSERLAQLAPKITWSDNIWIGVTVESQQQIKRIPDLLTVPAQVRFLCIEPMLTEISNLPLEGIHWVILGGESGPNARSIKEEWVIKVRDMCLESNVLFNFKQWGGLDKNKNGRMLQNHLWDQSPSLETTKQLTLF